MAGTTLENDLMINHLQWGTEIEKKGQTDGLFKQVHGSTVIPVDGPESGKALQAHPPEADGAYSLAKVELFTFTADCIPLLFGSPDPSGPIAAVHAGWRGVRSSIATAARSALRGWDLEVWIGPHIRSCCFEVKQDFVEAFQDADKNIRPFVESRGGKLYCDLEGFLIKDQLKGLTLHRDAVKCTHCGGLPSYRRDGHTNVQLRSWIRKR